nr:ribonuclease H-like domain-containing protein [Tanacetum cinerariifolium]
MLANSAVTYSSIHSEARSWSIPSEDPYEEAAQHLFEQAPHSPEYVPGDHVPVFIPELEHPEDLVPAEEQRLAKKNKLKARGTLLMALPDKHQLKFNIHKDAKSLMEAIEKRFEGNKETKKVQKTLLKQQYENFSGTSSEGLDQIHDKLQKLISQLEILEEQSLDDLFNNLKIYKAKVKGSSTSSQNIAFMSSNNTNSTNESVNVIPSVSVASSTATVSTLPNVDSLTNAVIYSFFAKEMDLKWQMAMLTMRARRFLKRTGRNLGANGTDTIGFDISKVECYNCHGRGHFARECRSPRDNRNKEATRRPVTTKVSASNALVSQYDAVCGYDWSLHADEEPTNYALMTYASSGSSSSLGSDNETSSKNLSKLLESQVSDKTGLGFDNQVLNSQVFDCEEVHSHESDHIVPKNPENDSESVANMVNFESSLNKPSKDMSKTLRRDSSIIEDWISDTEDETENEPVPTAVPQSTVKSPRPVKHVVNKAHSPIRRPINHRPATKHNNFNKQVTTIKVNEVNVIQGTKGNAEKASANWQALKDKGVIDSGCSRHMTRNISYISDFKEINGGYVAFGRNPKGGKISGKGKIKTGKLDFDDVYFVKELKFNLFSVLQMCDKKNSILFTDTECVVLSSDYKMPAENHVLPRVPRENNMYNADLKNVVPSRYLTCLFAKATLDKSNLWHRMLGHINFKTMNKLVKGNLVRRLPSKIFENYHTCVACQKGKQHRASYKSKPVSSVSHPLQRTRIVQETLHINFLENKPNVAGIGPKWLFDIDTLTKSMDYQPVVAGNQPNDNAGFKENLNVDNHVVDTAFDVKENGNDVHVSISESDKTDDKKHDETAKRDAKGKSHVDSPTGVKDLRAEFEEFSLNSTNRVNVVSAPVTGPGLNSTNSTNSFNTASPSDTVVNPNFRIARKYSFVDPSKYPDDPDMLELEDIIYSDDEEDVGAEADLSNLETNIHVSPILTTKVHKDHPVNQIIGDLNSAPQTKSMIRMMDVKSAFLYGTIEEEVYVCQPLGFEDRDYLDKVYKVVKAIYGLHQALRACQDKYVAEILRKFGFIDVKSASTPIATEKLLLKDTDGKDVDVHIYRSMIGSLMYLTSSRPDIIFAVCACARFQVTLKVSHLQAVKRIFRYLKGKTVVATSSTEAEYVAAASCYAQVLWIQNQLLDYGKELASPKQTALGKDISNPFMAVLIEAQQHISNKSPLLGVNTPRCDEDSIELMELMVFMAMAAIKKVNGAVQLRALIYSKKVVVTEDVLRRYLHLDDADGVECFPNEEIFAKLGRMGYEKPPPKLTFYKAFFFGQWKFLIHTLVYMVRNVDSSSKFLMYTCFLQVVINNQVDDLTSHNTRYTSSALTHKVFVNKRRVGKGFSGVETPLFASMLVPPQLQAEEEEEEDDEMPNAHSPPPQDPIPTPYATHLQDQPSTPLALPP